MAAAEDGDPRQRKKRKAPGTIAGAHVQKLTRGENDKSGDTTKKAAQVLQVPIDEFKRCLFYYLVERYRAVPENINGSEHEAIVTYGTCIHPRDPSKMTFQAFAVRDTLKQALQALAVTFEAFRENSVIATCLNYLDTLVSLRRKMAIGCALIKMRFKAIVHNEIVHGYNKSIDYYPVHDKGFISIHWARSILAHAKYDVKDRARCTDADVPRTRPTSDMCVWKDDGSGHDVWIAGRTHSAWRTFSSAELVDRFPVASVTSGFITSWERGVHIPAPGTYPDVCKELVDIVRTVEPCDMPARQLALAYLHERQMIGMPLHASDDRTLHPTYCPSLTAESKTWSQLAVRSNENGYSVDDDDEAIDVKTTR